MLLFLRTRGRLPRAAEVDKSALLELARALCMPAPDARAALPGSDDRTLKRQRVETHALPGFREASVSGAEGIAISEDHLIQDHDAGSGPAAWVLAAL